MEHALNVPVKFDGLAAEEGEFHAGFPAVALPEVDRNMRMADRGILPEEDRETDVGEIELRGDAIEKWRQGGRAQEAVGDIRIETERAESEKQKSPQDHRGDEPAKTIVPFRAHAVDHVCLFPQPPEAEKILRITLAVGIDLEHERNAPFHRDPVAGETGLPVPAVFVPDELEAGSQLLPETRQDPGGVVLRTVIEREEHESLGPVFDLGEEFGHDLPHAGLLVVDGHDDDQFRRFGIHIAASIADGRGSLNPESVPPPGAGRLFLRLDFSFEWASLRFVSRKALPTHPMPPGPNDSPWGRSRPVFLQHEDFIWFSALCPVDYTMTVIDRSLIIRYINRVHRTQEIDKVLGSAYLEYIGEADRAPVGELLAQVFHRGESVVFETSGLTAEGTYAGFRIRVQAISQGTIVAFALVMSVELSKLNGESPPGETLTVCAWTNRVKLGNEWVPLEEYLKRKFGLKISHGISPEAHRMMTEGVFDEALGSASAADKAGVEAVKSRLRRTARVFLDKPGGPPSLRG